MTDALSEPEEVSEPEVAAPGVALPGSLNAPKQREEVMPVPSSKSSDPGFMRRAAVPTVTPDSEHTKVGFHSRPGAAQLSLLPEWDGTLPVPYGILPF